MHQGSVNDNCVNTKEDPSTWNLYKYHLTSPTILLILLSHFLINIGACSYYAFCPDRATQFGGLTMVCILPCFTVLKSPLTWHIATFDHDQKVILHPITALEGPDQLGIQHYWGLKHVRTGYLWPGPR